MATMVLRCCLLVTSLLALGATPSPVRSKRGVGDDLAVASRTDVRLPTGSEEFEEDHKECYFAKSRRSIHETVERPKQSEVGVNCHGPLRRMSQVFDENVEGGLYQAPNPLALLLQRGAGEYDIDWSSEIEMAAVGRRHICKKHLDTLLLTWDRKEHSHIKRKALKNGNRVPACTMPHPPFSKHDEVFAVPSKKSYYIESDEAHAILVEKGVLVHPGIPVCEKHNTDAQKVLADYILKKTGHHIRPKVFRKGLFDTPDISNDVLPYTVQREEADPDFFPPMHLEVQETYRSHQSLPAYELFMKSLGLSAYLAEKPWYDLSDRSKRRKSGALLAAINQMAKFMAPDDWSTLKQMALRPEMEGQYERPRSAQFDEMMLNVKDSFELADSRAAKLAALSLIAHLSLTEIHRYIPSLSEYYHSEARRFARRGFHLEEKEDIRIKYDATKIDRFIEFLTSWKVTIGLPFGSRRVKDGKGKFIEIPNTLRQLRVGEIIHLYRKDLLDSNEEHLLIPESTAKKILSICTAVRRKSLHGLDQTIADGMESFDRAIELIDNFLEEKAIDESWHASLRTKILQSRQYLRTDFLVHCKEYSSIGDHCWSFALSDPEDLGFQMDCNEDNRVANHNHHHSRICERCEQLQLFFGDFRGTLEEIAKNPPSVVMASQIEIIRRDWYDHESRILKLKGHQLRTAKSEDDRRIIVENLEDGECLITKDWAMKLLPHYSRESTADFFGQRGMSWHVLHCLARIDGEYRQHNIIHIMTGDRQDSPVVTALLRHSLSKLKERGIKAVFLRSDQAGKGACDRTSAVVKRKVRGSADANKSVLNPKDFFDAVTTGRLYDGISYYLVGVENKKGGEPLISGTKIDGLSQLNAFTFEPNAVRVHRFKGIGVGKLIPTKQFAPNDAVVKVIEEGGKIDAADFWAKVGESNGVEKKEDEDAQVCTFDPVSQSDKCEKPRLTSLFRCPVDSCGQEFLSEKNLEKHLLLGKHRIAPERVNFRDYSLNQFSRFLEIVAPQRVCHVIDESIATSIEDNANGKVQTMGWALPLKRKSTRHSVKAKSYIKSIYDIGERTSVKVDARSAAKKMREERKADGSMYFDPEELLNSKQIASLFSTFKRQKLDEKEKVSKRKKTSKADEEKDEAVMDEEDEETEETEGDPEEEWDTDPLFDDEEEIREIVRTKKDDFFDGAPTTRSKSRASAEKLEDTSRERSRKRHHKDVSKEEEEKIIHKELRMK